MNISVITHATVEPILTADAKLYCKVTHTIEDSLFDSLVSTARVLVEEASQAAISQQTFRATFEYPSLDSVFGLRHRLNDPDNIAEGIKLPRTPIIEIPVVRLVHQDNQLSKDLAVEAYTVEGDMLYLKNKDYNAGYKSIVIEFGAGFTTGDVSDGETPVTECPEIMKQCVRETVAHLYINRGADTGALPKKVRTMMTRFAKVGGFAG